MPVGGINIFVFVIDISDVTFVSLSSVVGSDLEPSSALFRWVATQSGESAFGAVDADVNADGRVDVSLRYAIPAVGFDDNTVGLVIAGMASRAQQLTKTATQMFA